MDTKQSQLKKPEQKPEEFLDLQKKIGILYIIFSILLITPIIITFARLLCDYHFLFIFLIILIIVSFISLIFLDKKYIKYKLNKIIKIKVFRIFALILLVFNLFFILPSILIGGMCGSTKASDATKKSDLSQLKMALTDYAYDNENRYPSNSEIGVPESIVNFSGLLVPRYISIIPECKDCRGRKNCVYNYLSCNDGKDFVIYTNLESKEGFKFFVDSQDYSGEIKSPVCPNSNIVTTKTVEIANGTVSISCKSDTNCTIVDREKDFSECCMKGPLDCSDFTQEKDNYIPMNIQSFDELIQKYINSRSERCKGTLCDEYTAPYCPDGLESKYIAKCMDGICTKVLKANSNVNANINTNTNINVVCDETVCAKYRFGNCPAGCIEQCVPSNCADTPQGRVCTTDCNGPGSCTCPSPTNTNTAID